jgi:hypothetical protein
MTLGKDPLDRLAPALPWEPDWPDVLDRADTSPPRGRSTALPSRRRLLLALVVLAALLIPLAALGAAKQRWFWWAEHGPTPASTPVVIKEGEWSGHPWQLVAYRSTTDGLCLSFSPKSSTATGNGGGALGCGPIAGVPRTAETKPAPDAEILYMGGAPTSQLPAFIVGPVTYKASEVAIQFENRQVLRVQTFAGPASLGNIRFYATQVPDSVLQPPRRGANGAITLFGLVAVAGIDNDGNVVACLAPSTAKGGVSPLADCQGLGGDS